MLTEDAKTLCLEEDERIKEVSKYMIREMLKEVTIFISIFTLFLVITRFLFMIGMKDIKSSFPMHQEKTGKEISSSVGFLLLLVITFFCLDPKVNESGEFILLIILLIFWVLIGICFIFKMKKITNESVPYKQCPTLSRIFQVVSVIFVLLAAYCLLNCSLQYLTGDKQYVNLLLLACLYYTLNIICAGYLYSLSVLNKLQKVTLVHNIEQERLESLLECYWITQTEDWIIAKQKNGQIYYLTRGQITVAYPGDN